MEKPYKIVKLDSPQGIERLDNLLTLLFNNLQEIRHRVSSTTPVAGQLKEGEIIFLDDGSGDRQLYAKIKDSLFHIPIKAICKGWVNFDGTTNVGGNCTIRGSYNVDHVEDTAVGQYKIFWDTDFANVNYAVFISDNNNAVPHTRVTYTQLVGSVIIWILQPGVNYYDASRVCVMAFGVQ